MRAVHWLRVLRPHQWSKNLLVFVSPIAGHQLGDLALLGLTARCFLALCLVASAGYIVNDIADLRDDRAHSRKRLRPLASGDLPLAQAQALIVLLLAAGLGLAATISREVLACILAYLAASQLYTFWAKRKLALDVVLLAALYTVRIIAGAAVAGVAPSFWLLGFSMFVFFSLACVKRFVELTARDGATLEEFSARAYREADRQMIAMLGIGSGLLSVLVLAFYIDSREVMRLYAQPSLLWLACPLLLYWIARIWLLAGRAHVHEDPIEFALRDPLSYVLMAMVGAIVVAAT